MRINKKFEKAPTAKMPLSKTRTDKVVRYGVWLASIALIGVMIWPVVSGIWKHFLVNSASLSFRIDVQYRIDSQIYSGSGVWNGTLAVAKFPTTSGLGATVTGEAFMLTGGKQNIFLLRRASNRAAGRSYGFYPLFCANSAGDALFDWLQSGFVGPCEIGATNFVPPEIVSIPNLESPEGISKIDIEYKPRSDDCNNCLLKFEISRSDWHPSHELYRILPWISALDNDYSEIESNTTLRSISTATEEHLVLMDFSWK